MRGAGCGVRGRRWEERALGGADRCSVGTGDTRARSDHCKHWRTKASRYVTRHIRHSELHIAILEHATISYSFRV